MGRQSKLKRLRNLNHPTRLLPRVMVGGLPFDHRRANRSQRDRVWRLVLANQPKPASLTDQPA